MSSSSSRPKALILGFFPSFTPPSSGGEARSYNLWRALAETYDVTALTPTFHDAEYERVQHAKHLVEHRFPKNHEYIKWHQRLDKIGTFSECSALVVALAGKKHPEFLKAIEEHQADADLLIVEGPFFPHVKPKPGQLYVLNSYNVEYKLQRKLWSGLASRYFVNYLKRVEQKLVREADLVFSCSDADRQHYIDVLGSPPENNFLAPNGTCLENLADPVTSEIQRQEVWKRFTSTRPVLKQWSDARSEQHDGPAPRAIFLGSGFPPNVEAATFLEQHVAPRVQHVDFLIAGSCCKKLEGEPPENVFRVGYIDEGDDFKNFQQQANAALNPMMSGSGTSVKMLDFFGSGLCTIATPVGARGMEVFSGNGLFTIAPDNFAERLGELLEQTTELKRLGLRARQIIEQDYQWKTIGEWMVQAIEHRRHDGRKVIVTVDYPIAKPEHGGKLRTFHLARSLAKSGTPATILSLNKDSKQGAEVLTDGVVEVTIPRSREHNNWDEKTEVKLFRQLAPDDISCYMNAHLLGRFRSALRRLARRHHAVVMVQPFLSKVVQQAHLSIPLYFDAQNNEYLLKQRMMTRIKEWYPQTARVVDGLLAAVWASEETVLTISDAAFTTSQDDVNTLRSTYAEAAGEMSFNVCANGVDCETIRLTDPDQRTAWRRDAGIQPEHRVAIFVGSGHIPNIEAAEIIIEKLAPHRPETLFLLVGSVCDGLQHVGHIPNVLQLGRCDDELKRRYLGISDAALNPVVSGSGTNLKTVEYMAAGLPVLSTKVGVRGLTVEHGKQLAIVEPDQMADALGELWQSPEVDAQFVREGRALVVKHFDWPHVFQPLVEMVAAVGVASQPAPLEAHSTAAPEQSTAS
jgi:glycosyltransferase involved in cell wall biosynthesis